MSLARNGFIVDPTYLGQTAEGHVEFIKKNSIEEQYIYISRLTQKANNKPLQKIGFGSQGLTRISI